MSKRAASEAHLINSVKPGGFSVDQLYNVKGWVALVTGGGTGLGLVTATALADNGCKVYITGRRKEPLEAARRERGENGGEIVPIVADVSTKEGIVALRDAITAKETHLDLLVNNHGVSQGAPDINDCEQTAEGLSKKMFEEETFERWSETYTINTSSYYFTSFAFLPLLAAAKNKSAKDAAPGNIVIISSMSGITPTSQNGQFNYNAGKAATISLSKMLATEFARRGLGVRVNCICPGYFPSGMTVIHPDENTGSAEHERKYRDDMGIPFARPGSAVDYAQCILGLATNRYTTGAETVIDGGWLLKIAF